MVFQSLVKFSGDLPKLVTNMPGTTLKSVKRNQALIPLFFFNILGFCVAAGYILRLTTCPDTTLNKKKEFIDVKPDQGIPFLTKSADLANTRQPDKRPQLTK